jgi:hypothetical protein
MTQIFGKTRYIELLKEEVLKDGLIMVDTKKEPSEITIF